MVIAPSASAPCDVHGYDVLERGIWTLQTYIHGYEERNLLEKVVAKDRYSEQFVPWLYARKRIPMGPLRLGPIIDECNGDPYLDLQRFFDYLEIFDREVPFVERYQREG